VEIDSEGGRLCFAEAGFISGLVSVLRWIGYIGGEVVALGLLIAVTTDGFGERLRDAAS
jgi:hypothetical protein